VTVTHNTNVRILDEVVFVFLAYKQEKFIPQTLLSAFNQTCFPSKLIIMDDASPDNTDKEIRKLISEAPEGLNIEYLHNEINVGLVSQLNKLVGKFDNKLIVLQAGDDESYPNRLEETYKAWIEHNKPSLVLANYDCIDASGQIIKKFDYQSPSEKPYTLDRIIRRRVKVYGCCAAIHSDLFNFFGPIATEVINEDRINIFRAYFRRGIFYLHKPLLKYNSEVGISAFQSETKLQLLHKVRTEAQREIIDIECHISDLKKIHDTSVYNLLISRKKNVQWLTTIQTSLTFWQALIAIFQGVSPSVALKIYKKVRRLRDE